MARVNAVECSGEILYGSKWRVSPDARGTRIWTLGSDRGEILSLATGSRPYPPSRDRGLPWPPSARRVGMRALPDGVDAFQPLMRLARDETGYAQIAAGQRLGSRRW